MTVSPKVSVDRLMKTREVAQMLGVNSRTVARWIRDGTLPARKAGRTWRVRYGDVVAMLERSGSV